MAEAIAARLLASSCGFVEPVDFKCETKMWSGCGQFGTAICASNRSRVKLELP
jgi:starvation-inducible outer membrane lipoprotein